MTLEISINLKNIFLYICILTNNDHLNHNAQDICHKAIVIQTEIKNQCNAVVGIKVIYLVIFKYIN